MKIENRLVYIADDGQEFDSEDACKQYERIESLTKYIADLIHDASSLCRNESEEAASIVANNIITILSAYNNL